MVRSVGNSVARGLFVTCKFPLAAARLAPWLVPGWHEPQSTKHSRLLMRGRGRLDALRVERRVRRPRPFGTFRRGGNPYAPRSYTRATTSPQRVSRRPATAA